MKRLLLIIFLLIFSITAFGQADLPLIGKVTDLTGKKKIYIAAETTNSRKLIEKVIAKKKMFEVTSDAEKADFILDFKQISKSAPAQYGGSAYEDVAEMSAYFYNADKRKVIAWSETKDYYKKGWGMPKQNENYLTQAFLKAMEGKK